MSPRILAAVLLLASLPAAHTGDVFERSLLDRPVPDLCFERLSWVGDAPAPEAGPLRGRPHLVLFSALW